MDDILKHDLGKALSYFKIRRQAMRSDEYLAAVDTIIALKEECKSNAAFSKVLEDEGFTEELLPRNERSCITGWFADLSPEQRTRVIEWMTEQEKNGDTFRLQTAERHFAKTFNDEDEQEEEVKTRARAQPREYEEEDDEEEDTSSTVKKLQKSLDDLKAKYVELEQKLASMTAKDSKLVQENKALKAKVKELEQEIVKMSFSSAS